MKLASPGALRPARIGLILGSLTIAAGSAQAQEGDISGDIRGKMVDHSDTLPMDPPSSSERESNRIDGMLPSALDIAERRTMLEAQAPQTPPTQTETMEDTLDSANFESGKATLLPRATQMLDGLVARLDSKSNIHFEIVGHTDSQRIAPSLRPTFKDNQALSEARALAVANYLKQALHLPADSFAVSGKGETLPIADNGTPDGMAKNRRTMIRVWFDVTVSSPTPPAPKSVEKLVSEDFCAPKATATGQPFSISVDGRPLGADSDQTEADRERCVDVALAQSDIQIKYDPMHVAPALNAWVLPSGVARGKPAEFRTYTNYAWWLRKAELRIFAKGQNLQDAPLAVVPVSVGGGVAWAVPTSAPAELVYLLRVYDEDGHFDETAPKPLHVLDRYDAKAEEERTQRDALTGYGENSLLVKNISASGGTVTVSGKDIKPGQFVTALGMPVPVDDSGKFAFRQILPAGDHSVEVAVRDDAGVGRLYRRNLSIAGDDWFYVAQLDATVGHDHTTGPAALVTQDGTHYNNSTWSDGRGAFFVKGKVDDDYILTASADTGEQPIKDLFSNFHEKDPYYLLRNINPDQFYPVYGDDSTIADGAPTQGKFYVKVENGNSYAMWGDFKTNWTNTELTQYTRGLYGGNLLWQSSDSTGFGERSTIVNVFAAEPGTLQSRESFRGTGGSLYYTHYQDITQGSEQVWVEIRDPDSGLVLQRNALTAIQDYDIDYLQGRINLHAPLASVAESGTLVQNSSLNGNPVYLVVAYEYVPGLAAISGSDVGLRASHWFNDTVRLGTTVYHQGETGADQTLKGLDGTLRYSAGTWVKAEVAQSKGAGSENLSSVSGGLDFNQDNATGETALAKRVDLAINLADILDEQRGRLTGYWEDQGAGFSGPGLITPGSEALKRLGLAAVLPIGAQTEVAVKADDSESITQTDNDVEVAVRRKIDAQWGVSLGVREDDRSNGGTIGTVVDASPLLNQTGSRTDMILRVDFQPLSPDDPGEPDADVPPPPLPEVAAPLAPTASAGPTGGGPAGPASSLNPNSGLTGAGTSGASATSAMGAPRQQPTAQSAAGIAASHLPGRKYEDWDMYGYAQDTLAKSGSRSSNDRAGLGADWQATDALKVTAEGSDGNLGVGGRVGGDYQIDQRSDVYVSYTLESESQDLDYSGREGTLTTGSHSRVTDDVSMFAETRSVNGDGPQSLTHAFGVDFNPTKQSTIGMKFETGTLSDPLAGDVKRDAVAITGGYKFDKLKLQSALEYRVDSTTSLGTVAGTCSTPAVTTPCVDDAANGTSHTWLTKNSIGYQVDPDWRLLGKLNLSRSSNSNGAFYDGDYTEAVASAAYRPVDNDKLNMLFKYTYFYNLPSAGQVDSVTNSVIDYSQKSQVFDVDAIYDFTPWLSLGAKVGVRLGDLETTRTSGDWFSSDAELFVLRADLHLIREWDALIEARRLQSRTTDDSRSGFLVGVYRHIAESLKIGVGYNFTNFSDDMTDQSYRSRGWFVNALSTF
jgi:outer membrane protein OmpA-like peptidoglycan-associated protein